MSELTDLIKRLERGLDKRSVFITTIKNPKLLITSLNELQEIIGNEKVKDSVATQVSHLIMEKRRSLENNETQQEDVMLNTMLLGNPGVGKSKIGTILAKIYYALGCINGSR